MSTRIEQIIEEMEDFIDECKYAKFSSTNIIVERERLEEYLRELKSKTPEEIKRYQKIISNKEAILNDARAKADAMIAQATASTNHMISEHEIMQQAYAQAAEVCRNANEQAQNTLDQAVFEANNIRESAMKYIDDMLIELQNIVNTAINIADNRYGGLIEDLRKCGEVIDKNRADLYPVVEFPQDVATIENGIPQNDNGMIQGIGQMPAIQPARIDPSPAILSAMQTAAAPVPAAQPADNKPAFIRQNTVKTEQPVVTPPAVTPPVATPLVTQPAVTAPKADNLVNPVALSVSPVTAGTAAPKAADTKKNDALDLKSILGNKSGTGVTPQS
ncbi:MAG: DivIVA domain-containing protein [Lachnospiraceae bacterium]|nr:DivIVA domain-containing protein [Lachnospiraceae bacterium]